MTMRLAYVADGRSPIARSWIEYFIGAGHEVHLLSTRACAALPGLASMDIVSLGGRTTSGAAQGVARTQGTLEAVTALRHWLWPLLAWRRAGLLRGILRQLRPDLVHALRLPFEGMLAAAASPEAPLVVSTWGNDLTLHAPSTPIMRWATRRSLSRVAGLHADCERDEGLAGRWGMPPGTPTLVAPGNGGIRRAIFRRSAAPQEPGFGLPPGAPVAVQPRGLRAYVRNDTFFRSVPIALRRLPSMVFVCPGMEGAAEALTWRRRLDLDERIRLLPTLDALSMAALFRRAAISVSPSVHDGTPNTLLEAMACGCLPIAGDLESIREWIRPGENGILVDPRDPAALADAVVEGLSDDALRASAADQNAMIIAERADYATVMPRAAAFYQDVVRRGAPAL
jgi:glycosyltransferase involved in cell wall biosynthesis